MSVFRSIGAVHLDFDPFLRNWHRSVMSHFDLSQCGHLIAHSPQFQFTLLQQSQLEKSMHLWHLTDKTPPFLRHLYSAQLFDGIQFVRKSLPHTVTLISTRKRSLSLSLP